MLKADQFSFTVICASEERFSSLLRKSLSLFVGIKNHRVIPTSKLTAWGCLLLEELFLASQEIVRLL